MDREIRIAAPKPEACPAPLTLAASLTLVYPKLALASLAACLLTPGLAGVSVLAASTILEYAFGEGILALPAAVSIVQVVYSGVPRVAVRASVQQMTIAALAAVLTWILARGASENISPVDPMLYYAARREVERLILVYIGLTFAGVLYVTVSPAPAIPRLEPLARTLYRQPWLPLEGTLYGLSFYAAWQVQPLLMPIAFSLGVVAVVRFGAGKPWLAPLAYTATLIALIKLLNLTPQLEAVLP